MAAIGTFAIAFFTLTLWSVTGNAVRLAQDEFIASHRPKVIVHAVEMAFSINEQGFHTLALDMHCLNIGNTDAIIDELIGEINAFDIPLRAGITLPTIAITPIPIGVGQGRLIQIKSTFDDRSLELATNPNTIGMFGPILCIAAFSYRDSRGIPRQTGICRQFSNDTGDNRWSKYTHPGYETYEYAY